MRRWNGWGDDATQGHLDDTARAFLNDLVGPGTPTRDIAFDEALASVPDSRLDNVSGFDTGAETRLRHARGQSFPDWLAMRFGDFGPYPDAVATPQSHDEVDEIMRRARERGCLLLPYGGGTSVVGHLDVPQTEQPVLSVDMGRMNRLLDLDETSRLATFGAGTPGPELEAQLRAKGYVLGHFPQSFEYSTVGGWVVTRSSGQQSLRYGRIEQLFAGGKLLSPIGEMTIPTLPASSAGPDLRELVMGSEGRYGILTEAKVRVRKLPEVDDFHTVFFPDWASASAAVRATVQAGVPLSMMRLSNEIETMTQLTLAGHPELIGWMEKYLALRGISGDKCMLMFGVTGTSKHARYARGAALDILRSHNGVHVGRFIGKGWKKNRFHGPYLRNTLWEAGYAADTCETAVDWPNVSGLMNAMESAARNALGSFDEQVHAFTHLSHVYPQGSSIYSTFIFRAGADRAECMERWRKLKSSVSAAIVEHGGTISHQHGVGRDHAPYLKHEKGELGMGALKAAVDYFDPDGIMNPGVLLG